MLTDATRTFEPALYRRYLTIFLDGMRGDRGPVSVLPVPALSVEMAGLAFGDLGDEHRQPLVGGAGVDRLLMPHAAAAVGVRRRVR